MVSEREPNFPKPGEDKVNLSCCAVLCVCVCVCGVCVHVSVLCASRHHALIELRLSCSLVRTMSARFFSVWDKILHLKTNRMSGTCVGTKVPSRVLCSFLCTVLTQRGSDAFSMKPSKTI